MPISVETFAKMPGQLKAVLFLALLTGLAIPINLFGIKFSLGDIFFIPVTFAFEHLGNFFFGTPIFMNFIMFYILVIFIMLLVGVLRLQAGAATHG